MNSIAGSVNADGSDWVLGYEWHAAGFGMGCDSRFDYDFGFDCSYNNLDSLEDFDTFFLLLLRCSLSFV